MTVVTNATEPCGCGCECCGQEEKSVNDQIAELRALRQSIDQKLSELDRQLRAG
ncbi:MAG: hypothetical protein M3144_12805 [Actinomycetota bacterium]|nr:hypothetical protein [Actinomycetota bacterium]